MMDIVAALKWVRDNAEGFGGDPSRVLVFGQSGGGAKTSVLLSMPTAKGLFHRAGVMSGATLRLSTAEQAQKGTAAFLAALGVGKGDVKALQAMSFERLLAAQATMEAADRAKGEAPRSFSPSIDGVAIPTHPFDPAAPTISAEHPDDRLQCHRRAQLPHGRLSRWTRRASPPSSTKRVGEGSGGRGGGHVSARGPQGDAFRAQGPLRHRREPSASPPWS